MKLALIVPGGFGAKGPANTIPALSSLVAELAARHDVHVFAFADPGGGGAGSSAFRGAHIHCVEYPWLAEGAGVRRRGIAFGRLAAQMAREVIRAASPIAFDCFHAFWANEPGLLAGLFGRLTRTPVVLSVAGGEAVRMPEIGYGGAQSRSGAAMLRLTSALADEITVATNFARSFLPCPIAVRARVIPWGTDWRRFDAPPRRPPGPPWRLLHVASLNAVKDQATLLAALAQVISQMGDVTLDCVGEDTLHGSVQSRARALGLSDRVRFHGLLAHDVLAPLYRGAHLHVLSSRFESQCMAVSEAAAAGLPTVGTAVGMLTTLSPEGARCVAPGDSAALASAISELLRDDVRREAMGTEAQKFARAHDVQWTAQAFEQIYQQLATRR